MSDIPFWHSNNKLADRPVSNKHTPMDHTIPQNFFVRPTARYLSYAEARKEGT